jgi:hypothetical protein
MLKNHHIVFNRQTAESIRDYLINTMFGKKLYKK